MASKYAAAAGRRHSPIDVPLAAVAALAVGFAAFAMPGDLLSSAVQASGLPSVLPMAEPPLGMKARAGISLVATVATFAFVFLLLRRIGGGGTSEHAPREHEPRPPFAVSEVDELDKLDAIPRLRRADVHPDAPARRPILAARELGEPDLRQPAPAPFVAPQRVAIEPEPEPQPEPEPEPEVAETAVEPMPEPEAPPRPDPFDELELSGPDIEMILAEAAPVEAAPVAVVEPAEEPAPPPAEDASIAELMARLERGLSRRVRQQSAAASAPEPEPEPEPVRDVEPVPIFQAGGDDRLRSAMENLQRMAARAR